MVKNIILAISILLNVAVLAFAIWAYVMFNQGMFSYVMYNQGSSQLCEFGFENEYLRKDKETYEHMQDWCEKINKCMEETDSEDSEDNEVEKTTPSIKGQDTAVEDGVQSVYENTEYGFEFAYPNGWFQQDCLYLDTGKKWDKFALLHEAFHSSILCPLPEGIGGPAFDFHVKVYDKDEYYGFSDCASEGYEYEEVSVGGITVNQCMGDTYGKESPYMYVPHGDYMYVLEGSSAGYFDDIIGTFEFK